VSRDDLGTPRKARVILSLLTRNGTWNVCDGQNGVLGAEILDVQVNSLLLHRAENLFTKLEKSWSIKLLRSFSMTSTYRIADGKPAVLNRYDQMLEIKKQFFLRKTTTNKKRNIEQSSRDVVFERWEYQGVSREKRFWIQYERQLANENRKRQVIKSHQESSRGKRLICASNVLSICYNVTVFNVTVSFCSPPFMLHFRRPFRRFGCLYARRYCWLTASRLRYSCPTVLSLPFSLSQSGLLDRLLLEPLLGMHYNSMIALQPLKQTDSQACEFSFNGSRRNALAMC